MKKKIGIVTWYDRGYNFGSTLQAYAMQSLLNSMGYETEFINFSPSKGIMKNIKDFAKKPYIFIFKNNIYKTWKSMDLWIIKNLKISKKYKTILNLKSEEKRFDAVICGSDQIWNNGNAKMMPFYYMTFVDKAKRISYAPSIARDYIDDEVKDIFCQYVNDIEYLSIREKQGADIIKNLTGRDAKVVIDPTLLLNKEQWESKLPSDVRIESKKYIFCYLLTKNENYYNEISERAKKINLEVITPTLFSNYNDNSRNLDFFEFLNLIKNAEYIITDSFHGIAFSINLGKQFAVYKRFSDKDKRSQNSRIYNILDEFNLQDRLIKDDNGIGAVMNRLINYNSINEILKYKRKYSLDFLNDSIKAVIEQI